MISSKDMEYVKLMDGQPLTGVCRESDMGDFSFGSEITVKNHKGINVKKSSFSLHLQCPFRVVSKTGEIIFTAYDMYLSCEGEWMENNSWDVKGGNRYDKKTKEWLVENPDLFVKNVDMNKQGDLKIIFSNKDILEVFINKSTNEECWRFFENCSHEDYLKDTSLRHLVIPGDG
jgi:hypothetical protein